MQPIIRYEIGDIVTMAAEACGCGSKLPLIARVEGRDSDVFWIAGEGGLRPITPGVFETALGQITEAREYQVVQDDPRRFRIRIEVVPGVELNRERALEVVRRQLDDYGLAEQLEVTVEKADQLAPEGGNKFKRSVTKVTPPGNAN